MFPKWQSILPDKHLYILGFRNDAPVGNGVHTSTPTTTTSTTSTTSTTKSKINLEVLKASCRRTQKYCLLVERFMYYLFGLELLCTLFILLISAFRVNPYLLRLIIGKRDLRAHQPVAITAFGIARSIRSSLFLSVLFDIISGVNCLLLIFDLLCGLYLWKKTKQEIISIIDNLDKSNHGDDNKDQNHGENEEHTTIRNILNTLCILPISSYGSGRYFLWNRYKPSHLIEQALDHLDHIQKQVKIEYERFLAEKIPSSSSSGVVATNSNGSSNEHIKEVNYYYEVEALRHLHSNLSKSKPFELQNMEQVLDLITPVYVLWLINLYLIFVGWTFIYIFGVLMIAAILMTIWYRLSMNVGLLTPIVVPLVIVMVELGSFMLVSLVCLLWHWTEYYLALFILPLNVLIVYSLWWEQKNSHSSSRVNLKQSTSPMTSSQGNKLD